MKNDFEQLLPLFAFLLGFMCCKQPHAAVYEEYADFFEQKKYNGDYLRMLPLHSIDSSLIQIKKEVPPDWYGQALEGLYYRLPDVPDSVVLVYMDRYDAVFPHDSVRAFTQLIRGEVYKFRREYDRAEACLQDCYNLSIKGNRLARASDAQFNIGRILSKRGDYPEGIAMMTTAYDKCLQTGVDGGRLNEIMTTIARSFENYGDYENQKQWLQRLWVYANQKTGYSEYTINAAAGIADNYRLLNQLDSAKIMIDSAFSLQKMHNDYRHEGTRYLFRAEINGALGFCDAAIADAWTAKSDPTYFERPEAVSRMNNSLAGGYVCRGDLDSALFYYNKALNTTDTLAQSKIHARIAKIYEKRGNQVLALQHERQSTELNNRVTSFAKDQKIGRMQVLADTKKHIDEAENKKKNAQLWAIGGFLLLIVGGGIATFWIVQNKGKQKYLAQEKTLAEMQAALSKQALSEAEQVVSAQEQALEIARKRLAIKDELIKKMELRLTAEAKSNGVEAQHDESPSPEASFEGLRLLTAEDWAQFRTIFDQRFPDFITQLKTRFSDITPAETRLVMLLKTEFDANEIASISGVSTASVYTSRYRLRKKWDMKEEADLVMFIRSL